MHVAWAILIDTVLPTFACTAINMRVDLTLINRPLLRTFPCVNTSIERIYPSVLY